MAKDTAERDRVESFPKGPLVGPCDSRSQVTEHSYGGMVS